MNLKLKTMNSTNFILSLSTFLFMSDAFSQISIGKTIENANTNNFGKIKLTSQGEKYVHVDYETTTILIYNTDFTVFKTIKFPKQESLRYIVMGISDRLFDQDDEIEFIVQSDFYETLYTYIYDERGTILLNEKNSWIPCDDDDGYAFRKVKSIVKSKEGLHLIIYYSDNVVKIFNLPKGASFEE